MPRATAPEEADITIRWAEIDGVRREETAVSFVVLWHDQFGTRHLTAQAPQELLAFFSDKTLTQLIDTGWDVDSDDWQLATWQSDEPT